MIFVEAAALGIHLRIAGPGFRDQHHRGVRELVAAEVKELERVVEAGRVGLALVGDRPQLRDVVAEQRRGYGGLARCHPVDVAAQRIDLAVVGDHAVGVREPPRWEGVRGKALVHEGEGGDATRIGEVAIVGLHLEREKHALIDKRPARQRHGVVADVAALVGVDDRVRDHLAGQEQLALEIVLIAKAERALDEHLTVDGLGRAHHVGKARIVDRHGPPAEKFQAFFLQAAFPNALAVTAQALVGRHEDMAHGIAAGIRQSNAELCCFLAQKRIWDLDENAGAVAGQRIGTDRAAVFEILQNLKRVRDNLVRLATLHIGDEANATCIALERRIEQALALGPLPNPGLGTVRDRTVRGRLGLRHRRSSGMKVVVVERV